MPALYDELTDDIIKEAISELLAAEDKQLNATCELDKLYQITEEEAQQITRRVNLSCDRLAQAWDDSPEEYDVAAQILYKVHDELYLSKTKIS
ncbi:hypothetical protein CON67_30270 [Bacillus toyonensis]|nr:hypothetical protein CON67_30270 [Bacillus toyonensis]